MNSKRLQHMFRINLLTLWGLTFLMPPVFAAEYSLRAGPTTKTMPGTNEVVTMWGYALCTDSTFTTCDPVSVPGPTLTVTPGETSLSIHLRNDGLPEPVSIVIPGQIAAMSPVKVADALGRMRAHSFTTETVAGSDQTYTWANLKPGTYLYHSGTHPQVQVQMGLYGGIKHDAIAATASTPAEAYAGVPYDAEVTLFYSEIDPALHLAVAGGTYGTPAYPSTINYVPKYFLVNGQPYDPASPPPPLSAAAAGQRTLVRFLNAGLQTHVPVLQGMDMQLVAEDGNPYPYVKNQYSAFLPAAKTVDAILTPEPGQDGRYPIYDRKLALSNSQLPGGGMLAYITVGAAAIGTPVAANDGPYATDEDMTLNIPASGVLGNDTPPTGLSATLVSGTNKGSVTLAPDGSFNYTPQTNFAGTDSFTYKAGSGSLNSNVATVSITVNPVNDPPLAVDISYSLSQGGTLNVAAPGLLGNDSDPDAGDTLTAVNFGAASNGSVIGNTNGGFSYTPATNFTGTATFTYQAGDNHGATSNTATVSITVNPNQAPIARDDSANATRRSSPAYTGVEINVVANDSDPDGTIAPNTVAIATKPNKGGTVIPNGNGTVSYTPKLNFTGTETFAYNVKDNLGKLSNKATVRVNVTR